MPHQAQPSERQREDRIGSARCQPERARVAVGGATLETLWKNPEALSAVADKQVVVLQEDLPETSRASFRRHAKLWCDHVRKNGAEPVFYAACCVEINQ